MTVQGTPAGGLNLVGQIVPTNDVKFRKKQNAMEVAVELLSTHTPGGPVIDDNKRFVGFISEFDLLRALEAGKDLNELTAQDIMVRDHISIKDSTSIREAVKIMEAKRLLNLPVERDGEVAYTVTRHDLLRAWVGLGLGAELGGE
ncbi:MAG: CBS domain-containing protein [Nitrospirota bacterium]|nr:CBS domain-containing protein [Nitrospirota bacterium]